jgi:hypothetical protein
MEKSEKSVTKFAYRFNKENFNAICSNKAGNLIAVGGINCTHLYNFSNGSIENFGNPLRTREIQVQA